jgi:hypothetical protein
MGFDILSYSFGLISAGVVLALVGLVMYLIEGLEGDLDEPKETAGSIELIDDVTLVL